MKKTIIFIIIMVLSVWVSFGNPDIYVGFTGGLNNSNFKAEEDNPFGAIPEDFHLQTVYGFGGVVEFPFMSHFSLRVQPMFLQRCSSYEEVGDINFRYKVSYLELPVLVKATIGDIFKPYVLAGASAGLMIDAEADVEQEGVSGTADMKGIAEDFDLSLVFGAGFSYDLGKFTIFAEGLYFHGLQSINKGGTVDIEMDGFTVTEDVDPLNLKTIDIQLMVGVLIPLGKKG